MIFAPYPDHLRAICATPAMPDRRNPTGGALRTLWRGCALLAWHVRRWATLDTTGLHRSPGQAAA